MFNAKPSILLLQNDDVSAAILEEMAREHQYHTEAFNSTHTAWSQFLKKQFDICILDMAVGDEQLVLELTRSIRSKNHSIPIILLSAQSTDQEKIDGFDAGADDYQLKPINMQILFKKLKVFLQRSTVSTMIGKLSFGFKTEKISFDYANLSMTCCGKAQRLTLKEADLFHFLCTNVNRVITRKEILLNVWGKYDRFLGRSMDVFIKRLRIHLQDQSDFVIETVYRVGYKVTCKMATNEEQNLSTRAILNDGNIMNTKHSEPVRCDG